MKLLLTKEGCAVFMLLGCSVVVCPPLRALTEDTVLDGVKMCGGEGSCPQRVQALRHILLLALIGCFDSGAVDSCKWP